jgi:hypothetical protein
MRNNTFQAVSPVVLGKNPATGPYSIVGPAAGGYGSLFNVGTSGGANWMTITDNGPQTLQSNSTGGGAGTGPAFILNALNTYTNDNIYAVLRISSGTPLRTAFQFWADHGTTAAGGPEIGFHRDDTSAKVGGLLMHIAQSALLLTTVSSIGVATAGASLLIKGNANDFAGFTSVISDTPIAYAASDIHQFRNNGTVELAVQFDGKLRNVNAANQTATATAGGGAAIPATTAGFLSFVDSGGTVHKIPYYNV